MLKFIILAPGRCGSTMLESVLQQHDNVTCNDELLQDGAHEIPLWDTGNPVTGFKCLYAHIHPAYATVRGRLFWSELVADLGIRIVHIRRDDELARALSVTVSNRARVWHNMTDREVFTPPRQYVRPDRVIREILENREREAYLRSRLRGHPWLETTFETLTNQFQPVVVSLFSFLEVFPQVFPPKTLPYRRVPLEEQVDNWDEIVTVLRQTGFEDVVEFNRSEPWITNPVGIEVDT